MSATTHRIEDIMEYTTLGTTKIPRIAVAHGLGERAFGGQTAYSAAGCKKPTYVRFFGGQSLAAAPFGILLRAITTVPRKPF